MHPNLFTDPAADWYLGGFQFGAINISTTMNILECSFGEYMGAFLWVIHRRVELPCAGNSTYAQLW